MTGPNSSDYNVESISCPSCSFTEAKSITHLLDIPYYDDFLSVTISCKECRYRATNFYNVNVKDHIRMTYKVESPQDNTTKVVRSVEGSVEISELGITIDPVGEGTSWIRNIEGVLQDVKEKLIISLKQSQEKNDRRRIKKRLKKLKKLMKNEIPFTITVEDPSGNSVILPADETKLTKKIINKEQ